MERLPGEAGCYRLMAIDPTHYEGREQALVKHTFLDKYLPSLIGKVCSPQSRFREFVYVDGFSGPWQSAAGQDFGDTSFGIALNHMTKQRLLYLGKGHDVRMRAVLIEKEATAFAQLQQAVARFPKIEITPINGMMEDHVASIAASIPTEAFSFTLIDPKGFPEIGKMMPLLKRNNAEALVNFMFDFANRFAGTDLIPKLEAWLDLAGKGNWRDEIKGLSGADREQVYEDLAVEALRTTPGYKYAPVITVDKVLHNRPLYKLIYLTRHPKGLEVFRSSEAATLGVQAEVRSAARAKVKAANSSMDDLFAGGLDAVPNDRSSQRIRKNQEQAAVRLGEVLAASGPTGMAWGDLWPEFLKDFSVTRSWLGRKANEMRMADQISIPGWPPGNRKHMPDDDYRLFGVEHQR
jgi:three-Cys-motif partner protein